MRPIDPTDPLAELMRAARATRIESVELLEWIDRRLVPPPGPAWDDEVIERMLRIRRLTRLGINPAGIEVILHMRQTILAFRSEMARLEGELRRLRLEQEREIARLMHDLVPDALESRGR